MNFGLIVVGDEILSGKRVDKHLVKVIELLANRGLDLSWARYVGDDRERIARHLRDAFEGGDVVFCCGGIGATPDDHTRQAAAAALGVPLVLNAQARDLVLERMRDVAAQQGEAFEPMREDNLHRLNMATFPEGAAIIPNPYNKIAGFSAAQVYFVPGFPVMAWPMIEWVLDTHYAHLHQRRTRVEKSVIVMDGMEAALTPLMEDIERRYAGVRVFSLPSVDAAGPWGRHIEIGVKADAAIVEEAFAALKAGLARFDLRFGPEIVR